MGIRIVRDSFTISPFPAHCPCRCRSFATPYETHLGHDIDEQFARIPLHRDPKFGCGVIEGIFVVPIVPSLATGKHIDDGIVGSYRIGIVGPIPPKMSGRIHEKGKVQNGAISERASYKKAVPVVFTPAIIGHLGGEEEDPIKGVPRIAHVLNANQWIVPQIGCVDFLFGFH